MKIDQVNKDLKCLKIKNWRIVWEPFMRKYKCEYVCELGVYKGDNFTEMIKHNPKLAVAIDAWKDSGIHPRKTDDYTQEEFDEQYRIFCEKVKSKPFVQIIREKTINAAKHFPNNFFDLVYIDADHSYESCYTDIVTWYPKIKSGKFLTGHDYAYRMRRTYGVFNAVNKFASDNKLQIICFGQSNWALIKNTQ